ICFRSLWSVIRNEDFLVAMNPLRSNLFINRVTVSREAPMSCPSSACVYVRASCRDDESASARRSSAIASLCELLHGVRSNKVSLSVKNGPCAVLGQNEFAVEVPNDWLRQRREHRQRSK